MKTFEGKMIGTGYKFGLVVSRFNELISSKLLDGAIDALTRHDVNEKDISITWTPGSFEIPLVAQKMASQKELDGIICLGAIIRGDTPHFDYLAAEVTKGIAKVSLDSGKPITFGIITADTVDQAIDRAGTKMGNKGWSAAVSSIEMINLLKSL